MMVRTLRRFHALVALVLFYCAVCPFLEIALHSNNCIFVSGNDMESTLALLLLLVELAFALGKLLAVLVRTVLKKLILVYSDRLAGPTLNFAIVLPEISPPTPLRI
jgi:hypothetical protein